MAPGETYVLDIALDATGWIFDPGHRIRLAISGSDFPNVWPTPYPATNRVCLGGASPSRLILPLAPPHAEGLPLPQFPPPPTAQPTADVTTEGPAWEVLDDVVRGTRTVHIEHGRTLRLPDGTEIAECQRMRSTASRHDPAHASAEGETRVRRTHRGTAVEANAAGKITSSPTDLHFSVNLEVLVDGQPRFSRQWDAAFPRHLL
jgi:uncharacterized protein